MCAIVIKSKDDKDRYLQFCSNPQRKAAITWPAGDKYIFPAAQASKEQAVNLSQLRLQFTFTTEGLMPSNQTAFTNPANF